MGLEYAVDPMDLLLVFEHNLISYEAMNDGPW